MSVGLILIGRRRGKSFSLGEEILMLHPLMVTIYFSLLGMSFFRDEVSM